MWLSQVLDYFKAALTVMHMYTVNPCEFLSLRKMFSTMGCVPFADTDDSLTIENHLNNMHIYLVTWALSSDKHSMKSDFFPLFVDKEVGDLFFGSFVRCNQSGLSG